MQNICKIVNGEIKGFSASILKCWVTPIVVLIHPFAGKFSVNVEGGVIGEFYSSIIR